MAAPKITGRALHWVFKVGDREETIRFYRNVLGMKILRHEEFEEGCKATCNGPYDGKWSKTMVGYGPEDNHFVVELTYNYGIDKYKLGNDFRGITIQSSEAIANAKREKWPIKELPETGMVEMEAPGGYKFFVKDQPRPESGDPVQSVEVGVSNIKSSIAYWSELLGMKSSAASEKAVSLSFGEDQVQLKLEKVDEKIDHAKASGRIAFAVPSEQLQGIESSVKDQGMSILTPLVSLDTPGKATVQVVILGDPDGYEICFVGAKAFGELSAVDPKADQLLDEAMEKDGSKAWFAKKGKVKAEA